jgi:hypothetical protein
MEKKTRRTGGQSKPQPKAEPTQVEEVVVETPKPQPAKPKSPGIKRRVETSKGAVYEALNNKGPAYMLMSRKLSIYDPETDSLRTARYCPNENSIWKDEQSENSKTSPIIFRDGYLTVKATEPNLRKFLDIHPSNTANGGMAFKKVDQRKDAEKIIEQEFKVFDAVSLIKTSDVNDLLAVSLFFKVNINRQMTEIKHDLLRIAKNKPEMFIKSFDDPVVKCKATIKQALDYQIIKDSKDSIRWYDSNGIIVSVPHGQDSVDIMSRFCLTDKGSSVLADIKDQLDKLA